MNEKQTRNNKIISLALELLADKTIETRKELSVALQARVEEDLDLHFNAAYLLRICKESKEYLRLLKERNFYKNCANNRLKREK